ncbi:MAG: metallophosphoesterase [Myxococcota bacterium]|nr:metallophosphoesterase [Myxococcota bacterium]
MNPRDILSALLILLTPAAVLADGFDWGEDCSDGNGSFSQYIAEEAIIRVGEIPAGKRNVYVELRSPADVDVQLVDLSTGTVVVGWPSGILNGPTTAETSFGGNTIRYSGYNGLNGDLGYEVIEISGDLGRSFELRAFGYAAGNAEVSYSWEAPTNCEDGGSGSFNQAIAQNQITLVGTIPAGKANVLVELESLNGRDIDVQLYHGDVKLVVWDPSNNHGFLHGPGQETTNYRGMSITYSGYNGRSGNPGLEFIRIDGTTRVPLTVKVFGYQAGTAEVRYSWGSTDDGESAVSQRPIPPPTFASANSRVVAIGDLHGDYNAARRVMRLIGATNHYDQWIGGDLVVVQVGDQTDRGDGERAIIDMFERLADEAHAAGGAVYVLNGNHEVMNVEEDFRYVTPGGWTEFQDIPLTNAPDRIWDYPSYKRGRVAAFLPGGPYASILGEHNTVIVVNDTLFVHGGVHLSHVNAGLENINAAIQQWMKGYRAKPSVLSGDESPIWSRKFSRDTGRSDCLYLEQVLDAVGVSRMVVAHTVQPDGITSACNGQVWRVDVGMSAHYGGQEAGLEILGDYVQPIELD